MYELTLQVQFAHFACFACFLSHCAHFLTFVNFLSHCARRWVFYDAEFSDISQLFSAEPPLSFLIQKVSQSSRVTTQADFFPADLAPSSFIIRLNQLLLQASCLRKLRISAKCANWASNSDFVVETQRWAQWDKKLVKVKKWAQCDKKEAKRAKCANWSSNVTHTSYAHYVTYHSIIKNYDRS